MKLKGGKWDERTSGSHFDGLRQQLLKWQKESINYPGLREKMAEYSLAALKEAAAAVDATEDQRQLTEKALEIARKMAKRARRYTLFYYALEHKLFKNNPEDKESRAVKHHDIEKIVGCFKTHRCALDFDKGFVNAVMREAKPSHSQKIKMKNCQ